MKTIKGWSIVEIIGFLAYLIAMGTVVVFMAKG